MPELYARVHDEHQDLGARKPEARRKAAPPFRRVHIEVGKARVHLAGVVPAPAGREVAIGRHIDLRQLDETAYFRMRVQHIVAIRQPIGQRQQLANGSHLGTYGKAPACYSEPALYEIAELTELALCGIKGDRVVETNQEQGFEKVGCSGGISKEARNEAKAASAMASIVSPIGRTIAASEAFWRENSQPVPIRSPDAENSPNPTRRKATSRSSAEDWLPISRESSSISSGIGRAKL